MTFFFLNPSFYIVFAYISIVRRCPNPYISFRGLCGRRGTPRAQCVRYEKQSHFPYTDKFGRVVLAAWCRVSMTGTK